MPVTILAPLAALLYLLATALQLLHISQRHQQINRSVLSLALLALLCHAIVAWDSLIEQDGINLGFYRISSLIFLVVNMACRVEQKQTLANSAHDLIGLDLGVFKLGSDAD